MGSNLFASIIEATDDLARQGVRSRGLLFFPMLPWVLVMAHRSRWTISIAACLSFLTLLFVSWRFWIALRNEAQSNDEAYDREGKFKLSAEYHHSESATSAGKHKRKRS